MIILLEHNFNIMWTYICIHLYVCMYWYIFLFQDSKATGRLQKNRLETEKYIAPEYPEAKATCNQGPS